MKGIPVSPNLFKRELQGFSILALVVITVSLGFGVYQRSSQQVASVQPTPSPTPKAELPQKEYPSSYTEDEREVLRPVPEGAPLATHERFFELAQKLAIDRDIVTVKDCLTTPVVVSAKPGGNGYL